MASYPSKPQTSTSSCFSEVPSWCYMTTANAKWTGCSGSDEQPQNLSVSDSQDHLDFTVVGRSSQECVSTGGASAHSSWTILHLKAMEPVLYHDKPQGLNSHYTHSSHYSYVFILHGTLSSSPSATEHNKHGCQGVPSCPVAKVGQLYDSTTTSTEQTEATAASS